MLPEAGALELVFLAMVALIVVGPKDLPVLLRKVGQFTAKMRGLAAEFRSSFDEMARQSELDELRKEVEALREGRLDSTHKEVEASFREIGEHLSEPAHAAAYGTDAAPMTAPLVPPAPPPPAEPAQGTASSAALAPAASAPETEARPAPVDPYDPRLTSAEAK